MCVYDSQFIDTSLYNLFYLQIRNAAGVVENEAQIAAWKRRDLEARNHIYSTMNESQQSAVEACETAAQMWDHILTEFANNSSVSEHLLWSQLHDWKFKSGTNDLFKCCANSLSGFIKYI